MFVNLLPPWFLCKHFLASGGDWQAGRGGGGVSQGMRGALPSPSGTPALLQRAVPESGAEMVALEGAATIPGDGPRTETTGVKTPDQKGKTNVAPRRMSLRFSKEVSLPRSCR